MISKKMNNALNEQVNAELWSAYLYLAMSLNADAMALKGVANWFFVQWLEEQDHARIFQNYVNSQEGRVILQPIKAVPTEWDSPEEMFREALVHEREVTRLIGELVRLASKESDFATLSRLQWFVDEQVEEEESLRDLITAFSRVAGRPELLGPLDAELLSREHHPAKPLK